MTGGVRDATRGVISRRWFLSGAAAMTAGFGVGVLVPPAGTDVGATAAGDASVSPSAVDVGFFTDMSFHHAQALAMCQRVLGSDAGGPALAAAAEILQNQSYETGLMHAWLRVWGESTAPPDEAMGWMHAAVPATAMPGYATDGEMSELTELTGAAKGRRFLELMRAHHEGGVHMADYAAGAASTEVVRTAASTMAEVQRYDVTVFDELLATTYA
jgi:uncharacterized protein (DUF305 family)